MEEPFILSLNGSLISARIDRMDQLVDGSWELIDFKTARFHGEVSRVYLLQLQIYSQADRRLWSIVPERVGCHLLFLVYGHDETILFGR